MIKFLVDQKLFKNTLDHICQTIDRRTTIPILNHILIEVKDQSISLTGTNMDIYLQEDIHVHFPDPCEGQFTAPAHLLLSIIAKLPPCEEIEICYFPDKQRLSVETLHSHYYLPSYNIEDFPHLQPQNYTTTVELPMDILYAMLKKTAFSMSKDDIRRNLNGVFLYAFEKSHEIVAVATDGHRLSEAIYHHQKIIDLFPEFILPSEAVFILLKLLPHYINHPEKKKNEIKIQISDHSVQLNFAPITMTSKILQGAYPNYKSAIPEDNPLFIQVEKQKFLEALQRTSLFVNEQTRAIRAQFNRQDLQIKAIGSDHGSGDEDIAIDKGPSKELVIHFNVDYLMDIIRHIEDSHVSFYLKDDETAIVIKDEKNLPTIFALMSTDNPEVD